MNKFMNEESNTLKARPLNLKNSEKHWPATLNVIPAGVQTFSKMPSQHVDGVSPKFLEYSKGCYSWDIDENQYIDYMMGLGPIILGYSDKIVNHAAIEAMELGIVSSLPHRMETELSNQLIELLPSAEMVRFGKNGSDATSAAIRVARGYTNRDKVAVCGYHGWQDWYIGSTPRNMGVPKSVQDLTLKFNYNDIQSLYTLFKNNPGEIAAVILEPVNFFEPEDNFLERVKEVTQAQGALLIFDEIITGFRLGLGGAQEKYSVTPDLTTVGKAMANGFPLSAVVGRADIMALFEKVFYSFTFGGELVSIAASLATINAMKERNTIKQIDSMGARLKEGYAQIVNRLGLQETTRMIGFNWWPEYLFFNKKGQPSREIQSLFQQEVVRRGVLTRAGMMLCGAHQIDDIDKTLTVFEQALTVVAEAVENDKVLDWLDGDVIQPVIRKID